MKGKLLKNPFLYLLLILGLLSYYINFQDEKWQMNIIHSDGIGYYYYLPTLLNGDFTFQQTLQAEKDFFGENKRNDILIKTDATHRVNKYPPGIAVLMLPFFLLAYLLSYIMQLSLSGYSSLFIGIFYLGSCCYTILGLYFLKKLLEYYFKAQMKIWLAVFVIYFGTNLCYLSLADASFSHHFSFFLLSLFGYCVVSYSKKASKHFLLWAGIALGLIFLVRPSNLVLILTFLPFLWGSKSAGFENLRRFFQIREKTIWYFFAPFFLVVFIYFRLLKLQTGNWFHWPYAGEGFHFLEPKPLASLVSFQAGILLHFPVLLISVPGLWFMYKKSAYAFLTWLFFFAFMVYFLSSWWCWDYKYTFGNRAYSEFYFIFCFPLLHLLEKGNWKLIYGLLLIALFYVGTRYYQKIEKIVPNQKFTAQTFVQSAFDLKRTEVLKYNFIRNIRPYGKLYAKSQLEGEETDAGFSAQKEFGCARTFKFPRKRLSNRFYVEVTFDKRVPSKTDHTGILLIIDGKNNKTGARNYYGTPLYEYYKEAPDQWKKTYFSDIIGAVADSLEQINIYIWNQKKKNFEIRNFTVEVSEYTD